MKNRILFWADALLGLSAASAASLLIYKAVHIYVSGSESGQQIYTYSTISAAFSEIAVPVWVFVGFALLMLVVRAFIPQKKISASRKAVIKIPRGCRHLTALRLSVFIIAAFLIALGISNGGLNDVFVKAINICTECIGLG